VRQPYTAKPQLARLHEASLAGRDAQDGLKDGVFAAASAPTMRAELIVVSLKARAAVKPEQAAGPPLSCARAMAGHINRHSTPASFLINPPKPHQALSL
jgi:hypothetical protein